MTTTNPKKAELLVQLNGPRKFRLDMNALAGVEGDVGQPIHKFLADMKNQISITNLRSLLFHGLQLHHADDFPTLEGVGELMDFGNVAELSAVVGRALMLAVTGKDPDKEPEEADGEVPLPEDKAIEEAAPPGTGVAS